MLKPLELEGPDAKERYKRSTGVGVLRSLVFFAAATKVKKTLRQLAHDNRQHHELSRGNQIAEENHRAARHNRRLQQRVGGIDCMSSDELDTIWNRNAVVLESVEQCIHDLITSKAQHIPGKPEIFTWNGELPQNLYEWPTEHNLLYHR